MKRFTAILADGAFPSHPRPLAALSGAARIVCCDGALLKLRRTRLEPAAVVGDLDSLPPAVARACAGKVIRDSGQDDNDLSKAFRYCLKQGWTDLVLLGATGLREDHTLGNISLLADFAAEAKSVRMLTNDGEFIPLLKSGRIPCRVGQAVSLFSLDPATAISSTGLRYPLRALKLSRWWQATLNCATRSHVDLRFKGGPLLVFLAYARHRKEGSGFRVQERPSPEGKGSGFGIQGSGKTKPGRPGFRVQDPKNLAVNPKGIRPDPRTLNPDASL